LQHLTTKAQFQAAMSGVTAARTHHFALHLVPLEGSEDCARLFPQAQPWVGVIIPKRWARRAVTRNTIRRQIYELARTAQGSLPQAAMVVRLRSEFSRKRFISATSDVLKAAVRAELLALYGQVQRPNPAEEPSHAG
jgi:ribonuclease P protein component